MKVWGCFYLSPLTHWIIKGFFCEIDPQDSVQTLPSLETIHDFSNQQQPMFLVLPQHLSLILSSWNPAFGHLYLPMTCQRGLGSFLVHYHRWSEDALGCWSSLELISLVLRGGEWGRNIIEVSKVGCLDDHGEPKAAQSKGSRLPRRLPWSAETSPGTLTPTLHLVEKGSKMRLREGGFLTYS